jgi:tetratricopeptide (TPR) repeat protein
MDRARGWASPASRAAWREQVGRWLLVATILLSALGLGGLHTPVLAAVAVLGTIATGLLWWDTEPLQPRPAATALVLTGVGLIVWTLLQRLPLPRSLLAAIAAENADVWARCLSPLREDGPSLASISLEPIASSVQILRGITYVIVFIGALRVARRQAGVAFLERALIASAVAIAAAALVHPALGARKVFGLYEPKEALGIDLHHLAPLLNMNHLAAYVNIGLLLAFGSVVERREALPRPPALATVLVLGATTVWTLSRGGTAAMVLGVLLVALIAFSARKSKRLRVAAPVAVVVVATLGGAVLLLSAFDDTRAKFAYNDLSKLALVRNAFTLARDFPLFGVGRGAFEAAFPKVRTGTGYWVFTHPENVLAQWATEWGIPVALISLAVIAWALQPKTALARSRPPAGAWAALVAVGLHNFVDFSSEVPGVVIALAVCAAIVTGGTGGGAPKRHWGHRWSARPKLLVAGLGVAALFGVGWVLPSMDHELYTEQRLLRDAGLDRSLSREAFRARTREAMLRHPAEPYFPFVGAVRATVVRDESVLPWATRALERSPVYGRVHVLLARALFTRNPSQARLEYRIACTQDDRVCAPDEALRLVSSYDDAVELAPEGAAGLTVLVRFAQLLGDRLPATVVRLDREIAARDEREVGPVQRAAARALGDVKDAEAWCVGEARRTCVGEGLEAAARLRAAMPSSCDGHALTAELKVAAGDVDSGFAELDRSLEEVSERSPCARRLVTLAVRTGNKARVDATLDRLLKLGCESPAECVTNLTFAASIESSRGSHRRALALLKKAWERAPERDDLLADLAAKAEAQGVHGEALEAYTKLVERQPNEPRWTEAVAREREAVARGVFQRH